MKKFPILIVLCLTLSACASKYNFAFLENTVVDQESGLVWTKHANMAHAQLPWKGNGNVYAFIQKLNAEKYAGYCDWRVPSKDEFADLIEYAKSLGYIRDNIQTWPFMQLNNKGFLDVRDYGYWTSTRESTNEIWIADFSNGNVDPRQETNMYFLWPVRGSKK